MLGGMAEFFAARLDGYDEHMRRDIDGAAAPGGLYSVEVLKSWDATSTLLARRGKAETDDKGESI